MSDKSERIRAAYRAAADLARERLHELGPEALATGMTWVAVDIWGQDAPEQLRDILEKLERQRSTMN